MRKKVRIAAVSYLNTLPMVYGLQHHPIANDIELMLAVPSACAQLLREGKADLVLLPVGALSTCPGATFLSDYCIGAEDVVETVCIFSHVPLACVQKLYLDPDSRTSVLLARILLQAYWDLHLSLAPLPTHLLDLGSEQNAAVLLIGDKVFEYRARYEYTYDLAHAWHTLTNLPMVFAVWATLHCPLDEQFRALFNEAMQFGFAHIREALQDYKLPAFLSEANAMDYLTHRISYTFDAPKQKALALYLQKVQQLPDPVPIQV